MDVPAVLADAKGANAVKAPHERDSHTAAPTTPLGTGWEERQDEASGRGYFNKLGESRWDGSEAAAASRENAGAFPEGVTPRPSSRASATSPPNSGSAPRSRAASDANEASVTLGSNVLHRAVKNTAGS